MSAAMLLQAAHFLSSDGDFMCVPTLSEDDSSSNSSARSKSTAPYRRLSRNPHVHSSIEKQRRLVMTESYKKLKNEIPSIANVKASNVAVLQSAAAYIKELQDEETIAMTQLQHLRDEHARLTHLVGKPAVTDHLVPDQEEISLSPSPSPISRHQDDGYSHNFESIIEDSPLKPCVGSVLAPSRDQNAFGLLLLASALERSHDHRLRPEAAGLAVSC